MKKIILSSIVLFIFSCSENKTTLSPSTQQNQPVVVADVSKDSSTFQVEPEYALSIAEHFWQLESENDKSTAKNARYSAKQVNKVKELKNKEKKTMAYIINYDKGYMIISSDRRIVPILAYSDDGNFDENTDNPGVQFWI